MNTLIQQLEHHAIEPQSYYRRFENDFPAASSEQTPPTSWAEVGKRCALLALPFVSLYRPFGTGISLSMGAVRSLTSALAAWGAGQKGALRECATSLVQMALATLSVVATVFSFTAGLFLITGVDTLTSGAAVVQHLAAGNWHEAFEELLQTGVGVFYCAGMFAGHLEIVLLTSLLQGALSLFQARKELAAGRFPEAIAKVVMSGLRLHQAKNTFHSIQRRDFLLSIEAYRKLSEQVRKGREEIAHLSDSALGDLSVVVKDKEVVLQDAQGRTYSFGSHFHGYGEGLVKGANLTFRQVQVEGINKIELSFKVNHVFRTRLQQAIQGMQGLGASELKEMLAISHSHASDIHIQEKNSQLGPDTGPHISDLATEIKLDGLGTITVGSSPKVINLYDRVTVQLDEGKSLYAWHETLSFLDLDTALHASSQEDLTRLKIGHLFRTICPREATPFERTDAFFTLPIEELKQQIIAQAPGMKEAFQQYLDKMREEEILPGRVRYAIPGLTEQSRALGARGLVAAVTGADSNAMLFDRVGSMLTMGMLSTEMRYSNGINTSGLNLTGDFFTGGADSVYAQMITEKNCADHMALNSLFYIGRVKMMLSLDAFEMGSYQSFYCAFGWRGPSSLYTDRPSLFEFIQQHSQYATSSHELCFKERIPPHLIQGIIVEDTHTRDALVDYLKARNIIQKNAAGEEMLLGHSVEQFIHVGTHASEELFA